MHLEEWREIQKKNKRELVRSEHRSGDWMGAKNGRVLRDPQIGRQEKGVFFCNNTSSCQWRWWIDVDKKNHWMVLWSLKFEKKIALDIQSFPLSFGVLGGPNIKPQEVALDVWGSMMMYDVLGGGGFKYSLFSPLLEEMIQFDLRMCFKWVGSTTTWCSRQTFVFSIAVGPPVAEHYCYISIVKCGFQLRCPCWLPHGERTSHVEASKRNRFKTVKNL